MASLLLGDVVYEYLLLFISLALWSDSGRRTSHQSMSLLLSSA